MDYYRVPKGKTFKEGQFLGHGIHMTSYDKNDQKGQVRHSNTLFNPIGFLSTENNFWSGSLSSDV